MKVLHQLVMVLIVNVIINILHFSKCDKEEKCFWIGVNVGILMCIFVTALRK